MQSAATNGYEELVGTGRPVRCRDFPNDQQYPIHLWARCARMDFELLGMEVADYADGRDSGLGWL